MERRVSGVTRCVQSCQCAERPGGGVRCTSYVLVSGLPCWRLPILPYCRLRSLSRLSQTSSSAVAWPGVPAPRGPAHTTARAPTKGTLHHLYPTPRSATTPTTDSTEMHSQGPAPAPGCRPRPSSRTRSSPRWGPYCSAVRPHSRIRVRRTSRSGRTVLVPPSPSPLTNASCSVEASATPSRANAS